MTRVGASQLEVTSEDTDSAIRGLCRAVIPLVSGDTALKLAAGTGAGGLIAHVFDVCLFAAPTADAHRGAAAPPTCKSAASRAAAFALLAALAAGATDNAGALCVRALPHHAARAKAPAADFYSSGSKSTTGYVGLKNLGCICYMNACLQQFFMVPEFRAGILAHRDEERDKAESLMHQLQRVFAALQESEKQYSNPAGFCHAFKDWDGNPTNTLIQKDASEFLTMLFTNIETKLSGAPQEKLLKQVFGGVMCNELLAEGQYSAGAEPFPFLSVPVQNKRTLQESLETLIKGEEVEYKWEKDGAKVDLPTTKRCSIKTLPNHLIIHLKRFEFDFDTLQQVKLNDRFEFPNELDMRPYTLEARPDAAATAAAATAAAAARAGVGAAGESKGDEEPSEARPDSYYKYTLRGVVVHMGNAQGGHYYSFVQERLGGGAGGQWMEFNDTFVSPFDESEMEREAFGGQETVSYAGYGYAPSTHVRERNRTGFLLFYDRAPAAPAPAAANTVMHSPIAPAPAAAAPAEALSRSAIARRSREAQVCATLRSWCASCHAARAQSANRAAVPPDVFSEIWSENMEFWVKCVAFANWCI